jgi:anti-anti-sigma factor
LVKLKFEVSARNGVVVLHCKGRMAYREDAAALMEKVAELLPQTRQLILEISGVDRIDRTALGELAVILMWARAARCSVRLAGARDHIREMLELTNLVSVVTLDASLDHAVSAIHSDAA